jgi:uncharacterized membrane protein YhdT
MARFFTGGRIARIVLSLAVAFLVIWPIALYARHFLVR